ncbi:type VI secretion system baseplate subunit TssG [Martelella alba]|uniref:Type VI secretion system baseplate subunit TssG n=1 Tax=Martelella alba TaxID=2590451 RepID=A0ABY2SGP1_9HYPH|nr:type VI secretion system baseplate subunit TssG [Martelella alba]TKI04336.1 type VI secretion system baseplate subunit TssG [Martelella alba]
MRIISLRRLPPSGLSPTPPKARAGALLHAVAKSPWRFTLFPVLRRLDARAGGGYPLGRAPLPRHEPVRLGQRPTMVFAPSQIAAVTPDATGRQRIDIHGFGLFGPDGPLPLALTEYVQQRGQQNNDAGLAAFTDLFHHRLITLFYRAWADAQPCISFDRPDNRRFDRFAACLAGDGLASRRDGGDGGLPPAARYYMAGHFSRHTRNRGGLAQMLTHYFGVPVDIRENLFHWLPLPRHQQLRLSSGAAPLGRGSCLGLAIPDRQFSFRVLLGPLSWRQYGHFLKETASHRARRNGGPEVLAEWVRQYLGLDYRWEVELILNHNHYQGCCLGRPYRLGQNCWLGHNIGGQDRRDFRRHPTPTR